MKTVHGTYIFVSGIFLRSLWSFPSLYQFFSRTPAICHLEKCLCSKVNILLSGSYIFLSLFYFSYFLLGGSLQKFPNTEYMKGKFPESFYVKKKKKKMPLFFLHAWLRVWLYINLQYKHTEIRIISSDFRTQYLHYIVSWGQFYSIFTLLVVFIF